jgi:exodeoxyribonuclease VIII
MIRDVMVDLETLGSGPGAAILSIGAQAFDREFGLGRSFYTVINRDSCVVAGLGFDAETIAWWARQSEDAAAVLSEATSDLAPPLALALDNFNHFLAGFGPDVRVWGNGSDFDNAILAVAFRRVGRAPGWKFFNSRCYRTLKNLRPDVPLQLREGTFHNALDDARTQAIHAIALLKATAPPPAPTPEAEG